MWHVEILRQPSMFYVCECFVCFLFDTLLVLRGNAAFYAELSLRDFNGWKCVKGCLWSSGMKDEQIIIFRHKAVKFIRTARKNRN